MKNKGIIYKVTHKASGISYIGATTKTMELRKADHVQKANKGLGGQFQEAIATQGPEAFTWVQIDTATTINELAHKEKDYIMKYDSMENGLNSDSGGGMQKSVYQYTIDGSLINTFDSLESAANAVSAYKTCIGNACTGQTKTCKGYLWTYSSTFPVGIVDERKKQVGQFNLDNSFVAEYSSVAEASRSSGLSKTCISRCCRGERDHSGGYIWKYI